MGPIFVYLTIALACLFGLMRPCLGLAFYLFLVYLQPEWNWRWTPIADIQYQKYVVSCILIGWIISGLKQSSFRPWFTWSILSLFGFVALAAISNSLSERPAVSSVYFDVLWKTAVVALLIAKLPTNSNEVLWLTGAMLLGTAFNAFKINEDYFLTGMARFARSGWGLKGDNNVYTLFTFPFLVCSCALIFVLKNKLTKIVAVIVAVLMVHQFMLLESRGGFLGAILSCGILICFVRKTFWTIVALAVGTVVVGILAGPPVIKEFSSIFASEEQRDSSAASRLTLWKAASQIALDHPILGVGPNLGQFYIPRYVESYRDLETKHPHNFFLEVASGCGIPALLFLVFFMTVPVFVVLSRRREFIETGFFGEFLVLAALSTLPGFFVAAMFCGGGLIETAYYWTAIVMAGVGFLERELEHRSDELGDTVVSDVPDRLSMDIA